MIKKTAVIIKGNPKYVEGNKEAERFYNRIKKFLESLGYQVVFDSGFSHTLPPMADLWIGHSRGADRLRFAPKGVKTIALGVNLPRSINHPQDQVAISDCYHYIFTKEMKYKIKKVLEII